MKRALVGVGVLVLGVWLAAGPAEAQGAEGGTITAALANGTLTVTGTSGNDNPVVVSRNGAGGLFVNAGGVPISGGPATIATTDLIVVRLLGGNDNIDIDDANGPMPPTELYGGDGLDTVAGSDGADLLSGGPGNDFMYADSGPDVLDAGTGDDTVIWTASDDDDEFDGGPGTDDLLFGASNQDNDLEVAPLPDGRAQASDLGSGTTVTLDGIEEIQSTGREGGDVLTVRPLNSTDVDLVTFVPGLSVLNAIDGESDVLRFLGGPAADRFRLATTTAMLGAPPAPTTTVRLSVTEPALDQVSVRLNGGADTFNGAAYGTGVVAAFLNGGPGADTITGTGSADQFLLAAADGSDVFNGRGGMDRYGSDGVPAAETITMTATGTRTLVNRSGSTSDLRGIEELGVGTQAGADTVTIHDLSGTPVSDVHVDLRTVGADGAADVVAVDGTADGDALTAVDGPAGTASVTGAVAPVSIEGLDEGIVSDRIRLNGLGGGDTLRGGAVVVPVTLAGGAGADDLEGGTRFDRLLGGTGADRFAWASGQSDTIDGGPNADRLRVDGTGAAEAFAVTHPDNRVHVTRDVGTIDLSVGTVERLDLRVLGGADDVAVGDLAGSGVGRVEVLLASTPGGTTPDGVQDEVTLTGRSSADTLVIGPDGPGVRVAGMVPLLVLRHANATDRLIVSGASAADRLDATALPAGRVLLRLLGGPGNDVLRGSPGNDDFDGGIGTDTIQGGAGTDTAVNGEMVTGVP